eukprot:TRINITY_DN9725_c0_g1_i1.p1 TRINITY_DN9725_c0_g1~~TRINITY_DN9725_c0_g1_i1.p1  ORF type:complete len:190 (-),score=1.28 TRINITY_DN9725_c0_g1_i1:358-927(-)
MQLSAAQKLIYITVQLLYPKAALRIADSSENKLHLGREKSCPSSCLLCSARFCAVLCCTALCCALLRYAALCCAALSPCCAEPVLSYAELRCAILGLRSGKHHIAAFFDLCDRKDTLLIYKRILTSSQITLLPFHYRSFIILESVRNDCLFGGGVLASTTPNLAINCQSRGSPSPSERQNRLHPNIGYL